MAVRSPEQRPSLEQLRLQEAERISNDYKRNVQREYGTSFAAGTDPKKWRPYHVRIQDTSTDYLKTYFSLAQNQYPDLLRDDLPCMIVADTLYYPSFDMLYTLDTSFAKASLRKSGIFRDRDFEIVDAISGAPVVKQSKDSQVREKPISPPFETQKKLYVDVVWGWKTRPDTALLVALLGIERLIEADAIRTEHGKIPRNVTEIMAPGTIVATPQVLEEHFKKMDEFLLQKAYRPKLETTPYAHHLTMNRSYVHKAMNSFAEDSSRVHLASMIREAAAFSGVTLPGGLS